MSTIVNRIDVDGAITTLSIPNTLEAFQAQIGGWIETVSVFIPPDVLIGILDEEGKIKGLPRNDKATLLFGVDVDNGYLPGDYLAGPVLVVGGYDDDGEFTDIPEGLRFEGETK